MSGFFFTEFDCFHIYDPYNITFVVIVIDPNISDVLFFLNVFLYNCLIIIIHCEIIYEAGILIKKIAKKIEHYVHGLGTVRTGRQGERVR